MFGQYRAAQLQRYSVSQFGLSRTVSGIGIIFLSPLAGPNCPTVAAYGLDRVQSGVQMFVFGEYVPSITALAIGNVAGGFGTSEQNGRIIGAITDEGVAIGVEAHLVVVGAFRPPAFLPGATGPSFPPQAAINAGGGYTNPAAEAIFSPGSRLAAPAIDAPPTRALRTYWPPESGFLRPPQIVTLRPGEQLSRYGGWIDESGTFRDLGTFTAPNDVPFAMRSLPACHENRPFSNYVVIIPIENVQMGTTGPWFGQPGLGIQHNLPLPIERLIEQGFLRPVDRVIP